MSMAANKIYLSPSDNEDELESISEEDGEKPSILVDAFFYYVTGVRSPGYKVSYQKLRVADSY